MTTSVVGEFSVGGLMPPAMAAFGSAEADLTGQLAIKGGLQASFNASLVEPAVAAQATAAFAVNVVTPAVQVAVDANVDAIAAINAKLKALGILGIALGTTGIVLLKTIDTPLNAFGGEITAAVATGIPGAGPANHVYALTLVATTPAAFAALISILTSGA